MADSVQNFMELVDVLIFFFILSFGVVCLARGSNKGTASNFVQISEMCERDPGDG
jgi:hypothetical protein